MDLATLVAAWTQVESAVEDLARFPPGALAVSELEAAAAGRVARPRRADRVMGVGLLDLGLAEAWLAITDDQPVDTVEGLLQVPLDGAWGADKRLYQLLDLPWPFQDRHWVLDSRTNRALAARSGAWERAWTASPGDLPRARDRAGPERFDAALPVPVNEGAWLLVPVDAGHTLGVYQARVDLGGSLPAEAAERYTAVTLDRLFLSTERNGRSMRARYGPDCSPQPGGDGAPIPCFGG